MTACAVLAALLDGETVRLKGAWHRVREGRLEVAVVVVDRRFVPGLDGPAGRDPSIRWVRSRLLVQELLDLSPGPC